MKPKILIVEDDMDLQQVLAIRLRASGFEVVGAQDGLQAMALAQREQPHVVLLDLGLPAGDGYSVLQRLRGTTKTDHIPVVVLSARDAAENRPRALEAGAAAYLSKPVEPADLIETLKQHLPEGIGAADGQPAGAAPAKAAAQPGAAGKVMLVEDDEDLRRALGIRLKAEGFEVIAAGDATSVVTMARAQQPNAIVLDLGLPGGGGMYVLENLKQNTTVSHIPVLVLSARDAETHRPAALAGGAVAYFQKPAEPGELAAALRKVIQGEPLEI